MIFSPVANDGANVRGRFLRHSLGQRDGGHPSRLGHGYKAVTIQTGLVYKLGNLSKKFFIRSFRYMNYDK